MKALKAQWRVTAGVIPGTPEEEHTLVHDYTSEDLAKDEQTAARNKKIMEAHVESGEELDLSELEDTLFMVRRDDALRHAKEVIDPNIVNWVKVEFLWY